jgi:sulfur carrier protein
MIPCKRRNTPGKASRLDWPRGRAYNRAEWEAEALSVRVTVNGEARELPEGATVASLLASLSAPGQPVAVEVNRELVPRSQHGARRLAEGDAIEIVTLVGGG